MSALLLKLEENYTNVSSQLFPHISYVMNKYKHKIPKDDLKRFAKDVAKKLVASDYKAGRVENPTKISEKQQKKVKAYCKDYFDKAASKHKKLEEEKTARKEKLGHSGSKPSSSHPTPSHSPPPATEVGTTTTPKKEEEDEDVKMSDIEDHELMAPSPHESTKFDSLKRKRSADLDALIKEEEDDLTKSPAKKLNLDIGAMPTPPPPPPPAPPADTPSDHNSPEEIIEHGHEHNGEHEPDIHADTNFKGKSMADVLAQAQQEDEVDWGMEGEET